MMIAMTEENIERPRAGAAPTAFRIWRAGLNETEKGPAIFSARSAELLMMKQEQRGVLYPIDVEHASLNQGAPAALREAVGWHRLEARLDAAGEPELWAIDVSWCDQIRAGLERRPPAWRYISPVYVLDDSGEVTDYVNLAITNTPATWNVTPIAAALAEKEERTMKTMEEIIAALQAIASDSGQPPDERVKAQSALRALEQFGSRAVRQKATRALARVDLGMRIAARTGHVRGGVVHTGTRSVFHVMTAADARAELARRNRLAGGHR